MPPPLLRQSQLHHVYGVRRAFHYTVMETLRLSQSSISAQKFEVTLLCTFSTFWACRRAIHNCKGGIRKNCIPFSRYILSRTRLKAREKLVKATKNSKFLLNIFRRKKNTKNYSPSKGSTEGSLLEEGFSKKIHIVNSIKILILQELQKVLSIWTYLDI